MKIKSFITVCLMMFAGMAIGQNEPPKFQEAMARMKAERVSFLTEKLSLSADEAEKFWPVYNEYLSKREELMWGKRQRMPRDFDPGQMSEEELSNMLNGLLEQEVKLAQLKKDYFLLIKTVLPIQKVLKLHRVEQEFMNHMLNQIRDNRNPGDSKSGRREEFKNSQDHFPG